MQPSATGSERLLFGLFTPNEVLAALTLALVLITGYYAWQTRQTVREMKRARGVAVLPRLAISMKALGAGTGWPQIANVGPGPAIDVSAYITYQPSGPTIPWRAHVVAPNEAHELFPPDPDKQGERVYHIDNLTKHYTHIHLRATYEDALGGAHTTDDRVEIREWWQVLQDANERLPHDPAQEVVKQLEKIDRHLDKLASEARTLRQRGESDV